jgi:hypothetical protein
LVRKRSIRGDAAGSGGFTSSAHATAPSSAPASGADAARLPDIIRSKDGSLFRGTIVEMVVNDYVVIVTLTGESRRFALADVSYAGAVARDPLLAEGAVGAAVDEETVGTEAEEDEEDDGDEPRVVVRLRKARVKLESNPTGHSFSRVNGKR